MADDVITIEEVSVYETPKYLYSYHLAIESEGVWRVGAGETIGEAIENFVEERHQFNSKPVWVEDGS